MSEFSDCYFLRSPDSTEVIALLKRARRYGMILPADGAWVPFLVDGILEAGGPSEAITEQNAGILLHYAYGEDHGLYLKVFDGPEESFRIEIQSRGPSEIEQDRVLGESARLGLVREPAQLEALLATASLHEHLSAEEVRARAGHVFGVDLPAWISCADLARQSERSLLERFPDAHFVLKSRRGKADKRRQPPPNEWCPVPDLPEAMYLPVPRGEVEPSMVERHVHHWLSTGDFDEERQAGFWMYTAYERALPSRYRYLAIRIMNLRLAFPETYERALRDTIRGILAVASRGFDWEPYFQRRAGEHRL